MQELIKNNRNNLIRSLNVAAELEHGLCLQYLFTAFTLKSSLNEGGMTEEEFIYVRKWKANILLIAAQEMLHLSQVGNLSTSIGFGINLERPNFPQRPNYYPTNLPWGLWKFTPETIILYILYERPEEWKGTMPEFLPSPQSQHQFFEECQMIENDSSKLPFSHLPQQYQRPKSCSFETIGELYHHIAQGIENYSGNIIIGNSKNQISPEISNFPQLIEIDSVDDALQAIDLIVEQGEGAPCERSDSHFGMFIQIYREYQKLKEKRPKFEPTRDVQSNPLSQLHRDNNFPGWRLIHDPMTKQINNLNSDVYQLSLAMLKHLFCGDEQPPQKKKLADCSLRIMTGVIKSLGEVITQLPMGDDGSQGVSNRPKNAGPSFEMPLTLPLFPFHQSAWIYFDEQLQVLSERAKLLAPTSKFERQLLAVSKTLQELRCYFQE